MKTYRFLRDLLDRKATPKVPQAIRDRAYSCIKHYPAAYHFDKAAKADPDSWGAPERGEDY